MENSGPRAGEACAFPYYYPDCNLTRKLQECIDDPDIKLIRHTECVTETDNPWCYTKTYENRSRVEHFHWSGSVHYYAGAKVYAITTHINYYKTPTRGNLVPFSVLLWHDKFALAQKGRGASARS